MIMLLEAGLPVVHALLEFNVRETWSALTGVYVNTGLFVPEATPLTFHWYDGIAPPFTAVAVNVTGVPAQTGFALEVIETLTGRFGFTLIEKCADDPVHPLALGITVIVALPSTGVNAGIVLTPEISGSPIDVPPEMSKRTPEGIPVIGTGVVIAPLQ
jgi:hypothetical protein